MRSSRTALASLCKQWLLKPMQSICRLDRTGTPASEDRCQHRHWLINHKALQHGKKTVQRVRWHPDSHQLVGQVPGLQALSWHFPAPAPVCAPLPGRALQLNLGFPHQMPLFERAERASKICCWPCRSWLQTHLLLTHTCHLSGVWRMQEPRLGSEPVAGAAHEKSCPCCN